jgi:hypothetical protein
LKGAAPWMLIAGLAMIFVWSETLSYPGLWFLAPFTPHLIKTIWATPSALLIVLCLYARVFRNQQHLFYLCAPAFLAMFLYMFNYPSSNVQYDWWQNITTIQYYAENYFIPPEHDKTAEAHQAPLYYMIAGLIYKLSFLITKPDVTSTWQVQQAFSFLCFATFLLYGILILQRTIRSQFLCLLGISLMMYWPSNIMHCGRISNNIIIYMAFTGCAYHMMAWFSEHKLKELNRAFIWMGIAFATQTSAIILIASFASLILYHCCNGHKPSQWLNILFARASQPLPYRTQLRPLLWGMVVMMLGIAASYGRNFYNYLENNSVSIIFGTSALPAQFVPWFFFTLNLPLYIANPYIVGGENEYIINSQFWSFYLRSMSFGQMTWNGRWQAIAMNVLMLCQWAYLVFSMTYFTLYKKRSLGWAGYYGIFLFFCVGAQAAAKALIPEFSYFWADARYVYAVVVFFLVCNLSILQYWRNEANPAPYWLGVGLLACYNLLSFIHIYLQLVPVLHLHPY